jgi:hypothetical protein
VDALAAATKAGDLEALIAIFGPEAASWRHRRIGDSPHEPPVFWSPPASASS